MVQRWVLALAGFLFALVAACGNRRFPSGLEYLLAEGDSRILFTTYAHAYEDATRPRGMFDGLAWVPEGDYGGQRGWLFMNHELKPGGRPTGAVSRLTYADGRITAARIWVDDLARPCSMHETPWGTLLVSEEDDSSEEGAYGYVVEVDPRDPHGWRRHRATGRMQHEQAIVDPVSGDLFMTDDGRPTDGKGAFYRFVPARPGDLSEGRLWAFRAEGGAMAEDAGGTWLPIADPLHAQRQARDQGATLYDRFEDLAYNPVDHCMYVCATGDSRAADPRRKLGAIYRYCPARGTMERWLEADGPVLAMPDNLDADPAGNLWVAEDGDSAVVAQYGPNELLLVRPDRSIQPVMRGQDLEGEVSGVLWRPDGGGFWVAWQHGRDPRGAKGGGLPYDELYEVTVPAALRGAKPSIY